MNRNVYDLSHYTLETGDLGRLQTLANFAVLAGDSIDLNFNGLFRMSPLRRSMTVDAQVDLFAFYVPMRHVYGSLWTDFILNGIDETTTFPGVTVPSAGENIGFLTNRPGKGTIIPKWRIAGYNRIWNRYFRVPTDTGSILTDTEWPSSDRARRYGQHTGFLKKPWTTGNLGSKATASDRLVPFTGSGVDIIDINRVKMEYKNQLDLDWFNTRYSDIISSKWGGKANTDADERPTLLAHKKTSLGGYDVDGTGDANLGSYSGKGKGNGGFGFKRRFFPEHGSVFVMALVRFPTIHNYETNKTLQVANPEYKDIAGDVDIVKGEPPETLNVRDWIRGNPSLSGLGEIPFGQEWRTHPNNVHQDYEELQGFPFLKNYFRNQDDIQYVTPEHYDSVFQSQQLGQWQVQGKVDVTAHRNYPTAMESIFAGTR